MYERSLVSASCSRFSRVARLSAPKVKNLGIALTAIGAFALSAVPGCGGDSATAGGSPGTGGGGQGSACESAPNCGGCGSCIDTCVCNGSKADVCATMCSSTGAGGATGSGGTIEPANLPQPSDTCQPFTTGDMTFGGQNVKIWAGTPAHGPLVIYWYATRSSVAEVTRGLGQDAITEITDEGGIVAAMYMTTAMGSTTGNNVWYTGDFDITDQVVACAVQQQHIDTSRIHAIGFSAGGLQTGYMAYARSNYIASVVTYSGGTLTTVSEDNAYIPAVMCQHGDLGADVVTLDFAQMSASMEADVKKKGGFAIDCNHGGGHLIPTADVASSYRFLKDHPYKVRPDPYAGGIPSDFPSYCQIP